MIRIRQYRKGDEKLFEPVEDVMNWHPDYQKMWDDVVSEKWTWTGLSNGQVVAIGGILPLEDNCAFTWLLIGRKRTSDILRILKKGFRLFDSYNFDKWYAYVKDGFEKGCNMAKHLGFREIESDVEHCLLYENKRR